MNPLEFSSYIGDQPWFFVPDTGTPGGSAVLSGPDGQAACTETQVTLNDREWPDGTIAPGVGFLVPEPFKSEGTHVLTVTQDTSAGDPVVTTYLINVKKKKG